MATDWHNLTFVTGNPNKAQYLARYLGIKLAHHAVDVPEIQSVDIAEVAVAKAKAAYQEIGGPVLVEDAGLRFNAWGRLPGVFIKWMELEIGREGLCRALDAFPDRSAAAEVLYCLYDGKTAHNFHAVSAGRIADHPRGGNGFGFDPIFIHEGTDQTRAELSPEENERRSPRRQALAEIKQYLESVGETNITVQ